MDYFRTLSFVALGFVVGLLSGLSFLRTVWGTFSVDFFFWFSIVSTILGVVFVMGNVAQYVALAKEKDLIQKEKEIHKSQVKVWQHHADGIQRGLFSMVVGVFSSTEDLREGVKSIYQNAQSLFTSLNEERLFTDEEIKAKQIQKEKDTKEMLDRARNPELPPAARDASI